MTTKSMRYDHPSYLVPQTVSGTIAAASGSQFKFPAWTTMIVKSAQVASIVAGTGTSVEVFYLQRIHIDPTLGTATTTVANAGTNTAVMRTFNTVLNGTFTQGEIISLTKGTDGTSQYLASLELLIAPGASVTT